MFSVGASSHIISIVIMITMVVTVWTLGELILPKNFEFHLATL